MQHFLNSSFGKEQVSKVISLCEEWLGWTSFFNDFNKFTENDLVNQFHENRRRINNKTLEIVRIYESIDLSSDKSNDASEERILLIHEYKELQEKQSQIEREIRCHYCELINHLYETIKHSLE